MSSYKNPIIETKVVKLQQLQEVLLQQIYNENKDKQGYRKNLNPKVWGPNAWKFIDNVIEGYPSEPTRVERLRMHDFLISLGELLPCEKCRVNFKDFQEKLPVIQHVKNKLTVRRWLKLYKQHQDLLKYA